MDEDLQLYKVVLIGNSGTGKTNITTQYIKNEFYEDLGATVGVEFFSKTVTVKGKQIKITLWDTAGQERFKSLSKVYYKGARGILAVYDITDPQSYIDIQNWLRLANEAVDLSEITVFVVGNKTDLDSERKVTYARALKEYRDQFDLDCWQISAKTGKNINQMFDSLFEKIYQKGLDVKSSVFYPESEIASYSSIQRDSMPFGKVVEREMKPIGQVIVEEREDASSQIRPKTVIPSYMTSRMTLTKDHQMQRIQDNKKRKKCCF